MNNPLNTLAEVVRVALNDAGYSENTASERTGIPRSTLKRRLKTGDFTYGEMWKVADLLNTTPAKLQSRAEKRAA
jgi:lambda repressor-like predicted transcriptional regulator